MLHYKMLQMLHYNTNISIAQYWLTLTHVTVSYITSLAHFQAGSYSDIEQFEWRTWDTLRMISYLQLCQHHSLAQGGHLCRGKQKRLADRQALCGIVSWFRTEFPVTGTGNTIFRTVAHTLTARYTHLPQNTFVVAHPEIKFMTINDSTWLQLSLKPRSQVFAASSISNMRGKAWEISAHVVMSGGQQVDIQGAIPNQ